MRSPHRLALVTTVVLLLLAGLAGPLAPTPATAGIGKIAPEVLAELDRDGQGTFLVYLAEQADLSPAYAMRDWDARGRFVYERLRQVAGRTQPAVLQALPALAKTVEMAPCGPLTYTIAYANNGDGAIADAVISDVLPFEVLYITSTPPGVYQDGTVTWTVDIPAGGSGQVSIVGGLLLPPEGTPSAIGWPVTNTAYLLWAGPAVSSSATFDYLLVDLLLTKTVSAGSVQPGGPVTYTLSFANAGCDGVFDAVLSDTLPAEVAYITSTPPGLYQDGVLSWAVIVPTGQPEVVTVVGQVGAAAVPGTLVSNEATLAWSTEAATAEASFLVAPPDCQPVAGPAMAWSPAVPLAGAVVTCSATVAAGDPPITFTWSFGDGALGQGALVTHSYSAGGHYTVALTATNCLGAGQAAVREAVVVTGRYEIYLPLVVRGS